MRRFALGLVTLALSACASYQPLPPQPGPGPGPTPGPGPAPYPVPLTGQVFYQCDGGAQLAVDFENNQARIAIVGGPSMVLPSTGDQVYSNGRYALRGGGAQAQWQAGAGAPVNCRGS